MVRTASSASRARWSIDTRSGNSSSVMTLGMPIGLGVIVFTVVITALYVRRANSEYDQLTQDILKDVAK